MNLHEYQAREILSRYGVPVPPGRLARSPEEAEGAARAIGGAVVVKAQVHAGGRGKAGGVRIAGGAAGARAAAQRILGTTIGGRTARAVLVAPAAEVVRELYVACVIDPGARAVALVASTEGGVEIEETAARSPAKILRAHADPLLGLQPYQAREVGYGLGLAGAQLRRFAHIATRLYAVLVEHDASLVEVNPLAEVEGGELRALDAKIVIDDSALFRHPELAALQDPSQEEPAEREAAGAGVSYVKLGGDVGCVVNGAGLAMATMDEIERYGGRPANFLDIGGGANAAQVSAALRIVRADPGVRAVLVNIFGGITRCDVVARGLLAALDGVEGRAPIVVRLAGTNADEGRRILADAALPSADSLAGAAQLAVQLARGVSTA